MAERTDVWPRVHSCVRNWCPAKRKDCDHCDAIIKIMREAAAHGECGAKEGK